MKMGMRFNRPNSASRLAGFSLVELMVAMTLGLILLAGVVRLVMDTSQSHREVTRAARLMENGRYAIDLLYEELRHAGYYGRYTALDAPTAAGDPCATSLATIEADMSYPVEGYDDVSGTPPLSCLSDAEHRDGTDILVVRRASTDDGTAIAALSPGLVYLQSHGGAMRLLAAAADQSTNAANFDLTERDGSLTPIRRYRTDIYFVSDCKEDSCAGVSDPVPTLKRLELSTDGGGPRITPTPVPLVEGVEDMQLDYGIDRNDDGAPDESATGSGDQFEALPDNFDEWGNVVSVRVHLLMRSIEPSAGYTDDKRYNLGLHGNVGTFGDAFKRHVFVKTARIVNRSSRRER